MKLKIQWLAAMAVVASASFAMATCPCKTKTKTTKLMPVGERVIKKTTTKHCYMRPAPVAERCYVKRTSCWPRLAWRCPSRCPSLCPVGERITTTKVIYSRPLQCPVAERVIVRPMSCPRLGCSSCF